MTQQQYIELRNQVAEDVNVITANFAATRRLDSNAVKTLRERCFDARRRVCGKAIDLRLAICEVAGAAGKCSMDGDFSELSDALSKLDRAIAPRRRG
ncbi:MAG: hypothetical protein WB816_12260 [Methylocystis sp.]